MLPSGSQTEIHSFIVIVEFQFSRQFGKPCNTINFVEIVKIFVETLSVYTLIIHCNIIDTDDPGY